MGVMVDGRFGIEEVFSMGRTKTGIEEGYYATFPTRLRLFLDRKGETQQKLADAIKVHRQSIGQWKDGATAPDIYSLKKIAGYYNVSTDYLLGLSDDPHLKTSGVDQLGLTPEVINILVLKRDCPIFREFISKTIVLGTILAP